MGTVAPAAPSVALMQLQLMMTDSVTPEGGYDIGDGRFRAVTGSFAAELELHRYIVYL